MAGQYNQKVYVQLMSTLGHGYTHWFPDYDFNLPPTYPKDETRVGDFGLPADEDGGFAYLFNACMDAGDTSNADRVLPGVIALTGLLESAVEKRLEIHGKDTVLTASSGSQSPTRVDHTLVRAEFESGRGYEFTRSATQAAILVVPAAAAGYVSVVPHLLEEYAAANAHDWYRYFDGPAQQRQIRNGTLYLVTGFDKCLSWGHACYSRSSYSPSIPLKFSATGLDRSMRHNWDIQRDIHAQSYFTGTLGMLARQTIFLRGHSISVQLDPTFQGLVIGSVMTSRRISDRYHGGVNKRNIDSSLDIPCSPANRRTNTPVQIPPKQFKAINPSVLINNHLLEHSAGGKVALTHDGHWTGTVEDGQGPLDGSHFASHVIENNLLSVSKLDVQAENASVVKCRGPPTPETRGTFALIIGIDEYEYEGYTNLGAAVADADRVEKFLLQRLRTPTDHITSLRNAHATRTAIINAFESLIHDPRISPGMPIVIYYAGHGAMAPKPKEWTDWLIPDNQIQMLCPTDMGDLDVNNKVVEGIPDRTVSELLLKLATAKGNNIILILDCCCVAGTNQLSDVQKAKSRGILNPPKLSVSCDHAMHSRGLSGATIASGFSGALWDSHVLLTACNRRQSAWEVDGEGIFTRALLKVMEETPINELTCRSLVHRLVMPLYQTPQLEGKNTLRRLFDIWEEPADNSMILCRHEPGKPHLVLHAGVLHGINEGSTFEIFRTDLSDLQHPLATATVTKVETSTSLLLPLDPTFLNSDMNRRVWYGRLLKASGLSDPSFRIYCNDSNYLSQILGEGWEPRTTVRVIPITTVKDADLCLTVKSGVVFFDRGTRIGLFSPIIGFASRFSHVSQVSDIAHVRSIISCFAHFTAQLTIPSPLRTDQFISIEMNKLQRDGRSLIPAGNNLLPAILDEKPIDVIVDMSIAPNRRPRFGFTIRSVFDVDLYVYLFYFDATSFEIDAWYSSKISPTNQMEQGSVDPCLPNDAILTLGYGSRKMDPFMFTIPDGQDVDVCFFKLFVTTEPADLRSISQSSPFSDSRTPRGVSRVSPSSDLTGSWASIVIPVVQKTAQPVVDPPTQSSASKMSEAHRNDTNSSTTPFPMAPLVSAIASFNSSSSPMETFRKHAQRPRIPANGMLTLKDTFSSANFAAVPHKLVC